MYNLIIADSKRINAELIKQCLKSLDLNILISETGANIIAKSHIFVPDLVLLDVNLSDMSGYDVCKMIKKNPSTIDTLVLMINDNENRETRLRCVEAGADDFIEKAFDPLILTAKVKSLLRVKSLSEKLREKYSELEEKNRIIEFQLQMGKRVQSSLIKEYDLYINEFQITSKYMPAIAIGGDFYEVIPIDEDTILLILGDVSGHGISSALITSMLKIMIKNLSGFYKQPDVLLAQLNDQFIEIFDNDLSIMYACTFAALIHTKTGDMVYANAGHPAPILANLKEKTAIELTLPGTPIGLMANSQYEVKKIMIERNCILFFHTDGLSDIYYKDNPDRFFKVASELLLSVDPKTENEEIIELILNEFYIFNQSENEKMELDDVSIIICNRMMRA